MWPRRKIQLVASSAAPGIEGVRALLTGLRLAYCEAEPAKGVLPEGISNKWWEMPGESISKPEAEPSPVTELVFWTKEHEWNQTIQSFIHNILEDELILPISESTVLIKGWPLIGHVLNEAGFEPSLLWPAADGEWQCERKQGLYWLMPKSWLEGFGEDEPLGRDSVWTGKKVTWEVRETRVDFYESQEIPKYLGQMMRWPEIQQEQEVYQNIAKCLEIGVSWLDVNSALSFNGKQ